MIVAAENVQQLVQLALIEAPVLTQLGRANQHQGGIVLGRRAVVLEGIGVDGIELLKQLPDIIGSVHAQVDQSIDHGRNRFYGQRVTQLVHVYQLNQHVNHPRVRDMKILRGLDQEQQLAAVQLAHRSLMLVEILVLEDTQNLFYAVLLRIRL